MNTDRKNKKDGILLWAVDPNQDSPQVKNIVQELRTWAKQLNCQVQTVAVFPHFRMERHSSITTALKTKYENLCLQSISTFLKNMNVKEFLPPYAIFEKSHSQRKFALAFSRYAKSIQPKLIFINTRASSAWNPLRIGGFAETLITSAQLPVLVMNSMAKPSKNPTTILFPTDFKKESREALQILTPLALAQKAKVVLFHQVESIFPAIPDLNGLAPAIDFNILRKDLMNSREKVARSWCDSTLKSGLNVTCIVQAQKRTLAQDILLTGKNQKAQIIALNSEAGALRQAVIGSIPHDIILKSTCPVIIFHKVKMDVKKGQSN